MMTFMAIQSGGRCIYTVKSGSPIPSERAQEIGEYIEDLGKEMDITPANLVKDARRKKSKLHEFFEWDDAEAGEKWRLTQARKIINHFEVAIVELEKEQESTTKAFHSVLIPVESDPDNGKGAPETKQAYVPVIVAIAEPDLREQVLGNAQREILAWRERYKTYSELQPVFTTIDAMAELWEQDN